MDMSHIISVEGLEKNNQLSEVQDAMVKNFGGQCGFCTPGFVMALSSMFENTKNISEQKVKNYVTGNLCRCTGYQPIINAAMAVDTKKVAPLKSCYNYEKLTKDLEANQTIPIKITVGEKEFFAPTTLTQAAEYKKLHPKVRIFSGATDIGVQINKGKNPGINLMSLHLIPEMYALKQDADQVIVGARVNLTTLQKFLEGRSPKFAEFLNIFASPQIKNAATLVGNLANGSPIADTTPYLLTADAVVELFSPKGLRSVPLTDFIKGYKSFDLKDDEFITSIRFKIPNSQSSKIGLFKVSQRRDLDISCVNSSFVFQTQNKKIEKAKIAYGGVGPKALRLFDVEKVLEGQEMTSALADQAKQMIAASITPISDLRGSSEFRSKICLDLFDRFVQENF
tara:strand:- start:82652 stop:83839 length:1188 start_codon:yes stop_codon:yes gene_type:complete